jgi:hypothetical protein
MWAKILPPRHASKRHQIPFPFQAPQEHTKNFKLVFHIKIITHFSFLSYFNHKNSKTSWANLLKEERGRARQEGYPPRPIQFFVTTFQSQLLVDP